MMTPDLTWLQDPPSRFDHKALSFLRWLYIQCSVINVIKQLINDCTTCSPTEPSVKFLTIPAWLHSLTLLLHVKHFCVCPFARAHHSITRFLVPSHSLIILQRFHRYKRLLTRSYLPAHDISPPHDCHTPLNVVPTRTHVMLTSCHTKRALLCSPYASPHPAHVHP